METNQNLLETNLVLDPLSQMYLKETAGWAKFFGILGFISTGIVAIFSFFIGAILTKVVETIPTVPFTSFAALKMMGGGITIIYLLFSLLTFFLSLFLFRFGYKMKIALKNSDQDELILALKNIKNHFKLIGILILIELGFFALFFIFAIIAAAFIHH